MFATIFLFDKQVKFISNITKEVLTQEEQNLKLFFLKSYRGIAKGEKLSYRCHCFTLEGPLDKNSAKS